MNFKKIILFISTFVALTLLFNSCEKNKRTITISSNNVIIINQGNYTEQNGSISLFNEDSLTIINRAFETANQFSLGACLQGGTVTKNGDLVILCSNPDKMVISNALTLKYKSVVSTKVSTPRSVISGADKIYVTNYGTEYEIDNYGLYVYTKSYISIYDNTNYSLLDTIAVGSNAEGMLLNGTDLYVGTIEGVKVIDVNLGIVLKTITEPSLGAIKYFVTGEDGIIYASCPSYGLIAIDPSTKTIINKYPMSIDYDGYITTNKDSSRIFSYYTTYDAQWNPTSSLNYFDIESKSAEQITTGTYFYNIGVSPFTGNIYTTETSFTANSILNIYDSDLNQISTPQIMAGVGTYRYIFYQNSEVIEE